MTISFKSADGVEETFKYSLFLVLMNRAVTCSVAVISLLVRSGGCSPLVPPGWHGR